MVLCGRWRRSSRCGRRLPPRPFSYHGGRKHAGGAGLRGPCPHLAHTPTHLPLMPVCSWTQLEQRHQAQGHGSLALSTVALPGRARRQRRGHLISKSCTCPVPGRAMCPCGHCPSPVPAPLWILLQSLCRILDTSPVPDPRFVDIVSGSVLAFPLSSSCVLIN